MEETCLRNALLSLHGSLIDCERRAYEKANGRVTGAEFLQELLRDPAFSWIGRLTGLIASFDERGCDEASMHGRLLRARARMLLRGEGEFRAKAVERVQSSPEVAFAHAAAVHALGRL